LYRVCFALSLCCMLFVFLYHVCFAVPFLLCFTFVVYHVWFALLLWCTMFVLLYPCSVPCLFCFILVLNRVYFALPLLFSINFVVYPACFYFLPLWVPCSFSFLLYHDLLDRKFMPCLFSFLLYHDLLDRKFMPCLFSFVLYRFTFLLFYPRVVRVYFVLPVCCIMLLVHGGIIRPVVSASTLAWSVRYIYY